MGAVVDVLSYSEWVDWDWSQPWHVVVQTTDSFVSLAARPSTQNNVSRCKL